MRELEIVKCMCSIYGIDLEEAIILTGLNYETSNKCENVETNKESDKMQNIKPFDGIVKENCCKAVVYNHGLYTQCTNETNREFCSSVCKKVKYGHINHRKNYPVGSYVLENGKREISYQKVKKRLTRKNSLEVNQARIITEDSDDEYSTKNEVCITKNPRGRPKINSKEIEINIDSRENNRQYKDDEDIFEEVCVRRQTIDGKEYLVSEHNVVFDAKTYMMIGKFVLGKIIKNV